MSTATARPDVGPDGRLMRHQSGDARVTEREIGCVCFLLCSFIDAGRFLAFSFVLPHARFQVLYAPLLHYLL